MTHINCWKEIFIILNKTNQVVDRSYWKEHEILKVFEIRIWKIIGIGQWICSMYPVSKIREQLPLKEQISVAKPWVKS